jgi:hypothetical protein
MSAVATVDDLDVKSREFYERARFKLALSLLTAALAMMLLGFCASAGAEAQVDNLLYSSSTNLPSFYKTMVSSEGSSQGFACFLYLVCFFLALALSLYISPLLGSENEKRMLHSPTNVNADGAASANSAPEVSSA